jgi:hypothetical protein
MTTYKAHIGDIYVPLTLHLSQVRESVDNNAEYDIQEYDVHDQEEKELNSP